MTEIQLERVGARVLKEIELTVSGGELFVMLGPSGAGKSTLLQVIAGLLAYQGVIRFDGRCIDRLPPHKRGVGYLFQDLLLFPHLTIRKNLLLAMTRLKSTRQAKHRKTMALLERFGVLHLADRLPGEMSGGEKQRAALARAIATEPRILLLDEPFSSLDERTAGHLRSELKTHQRHFKITTLFVTHNLSEAHELADRIGVIREGQLAPCPSLLALDQAEEGAGAIAGINNEFKKGEVENDIQEGHAKFAGCGAGGAHRIGTGRSFGQRGGCQDRRSGLCSSFDHQCHHRDRTIV
jgi:ABC-type sugar transport system ATPase subunit